MTAPSLKKYDKSYFDKWYRDPRHQVTTPAEFRYRAAMVVGVAEYYLQRPVRSVLDVGCGEGQWQPVLKRMRPRLRYLGIDPSEYAIERYGKRRNLQLGSFGDLGEVALGSDYDLIICSNLLYYVADEELDRGLRVLAPRLGGVAFLEAYSSDESLEGDTRSMHSRSTAVYRRLFRRHGLRSCGSHCYVGPALAGALTDLEAGGV